MATTVLTDAFLTVNAVDLSDHVESLTLNYSAELVDDTAMGDDTRINLGGLKNWSLEVTWKQDYAASQVDATMFDIVGTSIAFAARPTSDVISATNPEFQGTGIVESYQPLGGSVGDGHTSSSTIQSAGTLVRDITP